MSRPSKKGGWNKPRRTELSVFLEETLFPRLYTECGRLFPELGLVDRGDHLEATRWPSDFPIVVEGPRPERIHVYPDRPSGFYLHGRQGMTWFTYANRGTKPSGAAFVEIARHFCDQLGIPFPDRELTDEEKQQANEWEERRPLLAAVTKVCQAAIWEEAAAPVRDYLHGRGFSDDDIRNLGFGFHLSMEEMRPRVAAEGVNVQAALDRRALCARMCGYLVLPWNDPYGAPLSLYGRWPVKQPPLMKDHPGWVRERESKFKAWSELTEEERATKLWTEPALPKTWALPGSGTKSAPLFFDRARKSNCPSTLTAVEGLLDAAILQVRGAANAVAYVAACFSKDQVECLVRHGVTKVVIVPDPDGGGDEGALSSIRSLRAAGIEAYVATRLPEGLDPDEFVLKHGIHVFEEQILRDPTPGGIYEVQQLLKTVDRDSPEIDRRNVVDLVAKLAAKIDNAFDSHEIIRLTAQRTGFTGDVVKKRFRSESAGGKGKPAEQGLSATRTSSDETYTIVKGQLCRIADSPQGPAIVPLCNFVAQVVEEVVRDDGVEQTRRLVVEGRLANGKPLPPVEISAEEFLSGTWPLAKWGTPAIVFAGQGVKDHVRAAIQMRSGETPRRTIFTSMGWVEIEGRWVYLHAGGGICSDGVAEAVSVELDDRLQDFVIAIPPEGKDLAEAVQTLLDITRGLAPDRVTLPTLMTAVRSVLPDARHATHLSGRTGSFKTELAALLQQLFGPKLHAKNLPGNWHSTANSLEIVAFIAKNAMIVVDDFNPIGGMNEVNRWHRDADRLIRAQGNGSGRQRLRPDGTLRASKPPRGLILSTGEDNPRGHSLLSRLLIVEVGRNAISQPRLTECQTHAAQGIYAKAMAGYLRWLAGRFSSVHSDLVTAAERIRNEIAGSGDSFHRRTPMMAADLIAGFELFLRFAVESKAIDGRQSADLAQRARAALLLLATEQAEHQETADPVPRFFSLLRTVLSSGRAHATTARGERPLTDPAFWGWRPATETANPSVAWTPQGKQIGWVEGAELYLDPEAVYAELQSLAHAQGESLALSNETLRRRLKEKGMLASVDETRGRTLVRKVFGGSRRSVLHLHASDVLDERDAWASPKRPTDTEGTTNGVSANDDQETNYETPRASGPHGPENPVGERAVRGEEENPIWEVTVAKSRKALLEWWQIPMAAWLTGILSSAYIPRVAVINAASREFGVAATPRAEAVLSEYAALIGVATATVGDEVMWALPVIPKTGVMSSMAGEGLREHQRRGREARPDF